MRCVRDSRSVVRRLCALTAVTATFLAVAGSAAHASTPIISFHTSTSTSEAGGHPDYIVEFTLNDHNAIPTPCDCDDAKDITAHLPTGLIGNPHATPQCDVAKFAANLCPPDSQVGIVEVVVSLSQGEGPDEGPSFDTPLINLIPPPSDPGLLGFKIGGVFPTFEVVSARTGGDYGLDVETTSIEHDTPLDHFFQDTWGVPASPIHNNLRFGLGQNGGVGSLAGLFGGPAESVFCDAEGNPSTADPATVYKICMPEEGFIGAVGEINVGQPSGGPGYPVPSESPEEPFLQNPTTCGLTSLSTSLDVLSYDGGETHANSTWPATTDCAQLSFNPSQSIEPTTTAADSPSGAEFRLTVPQFESPKTPSPSELKAAVVTLPKGFSFAPNVTNGKTTCSEAEAKFGTTEEAHCPEDAKIGTITVETPVLPGPLPGAAYLGEPKPGNRFRIFLVFDGFGVHVKLGGSATPNPETGQIVISFQNLPQAPFALFNLHVFGSERGPLDTPTQCGTYEVTNEWTPWDSTLPDQLSTQFFKVTEGPGGTPCPNGPRPFHPAFKAASASNTAAAHTSFSLDLTRQDGEQNLASLKVTTPPGFAATLKGVSYCPDAAIADAALESHTGLAEQASPNCPASSYVGELTAGAGPGTHPLYLPGKVYLAGPYQGAPLSFVFITPAVSGGYDLGNVVVREALHINPETAQVIAGGAQLPQIFQGIPLRLRQILINLNRPSFVLNPTNCNPLAVTAQVFGTEGALSNSSQLFQVANCASLAFKPKLSLRLSGAAKRLGNPAISATLTYPSGSDSANLSSTEVALPPTLLLDNAHIQAPCTLKQFAQKACPPSTVIGFAKAETPLLEKPLEGPVYLRNGSHKLPDIVSALSGQIGEINLVGHVDSTHARLRTRFETIPDAPISRFTLQLYGGRKGLTENSEGLCSGPQIAAVGLDAQNGKSISANQRIQLPCGHKHQKRAHLARAKRGRGARR